MKSKSTTTLKKLSERLPKPWLPHTYQKKAVKFLLEHAAAALLLDPGLGKTSVSLAAFSFLMKRKVAFRALVIAPLRVCHQVWPAEAAEWKDFAHLKVVVLHGTKKEQLLQEEADIFCINPEGLPWLLDRSPKEWKKLGFDTLIIDELSKFKSPKGVRFKMLKKVLSTFARRWGLTGSPAANGLMDLFGQCYILDEGASLGRYISHYRMLYFNNPDKQGWKWVPRAGAKELIYDKIKPLALRMAAEDYLELPEINDLWTSLDLPPKARKIYDLLEDDLIAKIDEGIVVAANAAAAGSKLWQICNGGLYVDEDILAVIGGESKGRKELVIHDVKTDWLEELINELNGTPLLVGYQFEHDLHRLQERFGKAVPRLGVNSRLDKLTEDAWNRDELPLLVAQQDAIAHGLNLQRGSAAHLAHYSMTYNYETYDQLLKRIRRQGSKAKRVFRHHAIIKDSTDEDRRYALRHKDGTQRHLFEALKARRR